MDSLGIYLLLLFGCFQNNNSQVPGWTEEQEGSGKISSTGVIVLDVMSCCNKIFLIFAFGTPTYTQCVLYLSLVNVYIQV